MDCRTVQQNLDEYREGLLSAADHEEMSKHLGGCPECRASMASLQVLVDSLGRLPVEPATPGFAEQALRRARDMHRSNPVRLPAVMKHKVSVWFATGFGGALAATLLLWSVAFLPKPMPSEVPAVQFSLNQTRAIHLAFNSPEEFRGLTLTVEVPANFEIANRHGERSLSWHTNLRKGANMLTLPVVAVSAGKGDLVARLKGDQKEKTFRVPLAAGT